MLTFVENNCHPAFRDIELSDNVERAIHELKEINVSSRQLLSLKPSYKNPEKQVIASKEIHL